MIRIVASTVIAALLLIGAAGLLHGSKEAISCVSGAALSATAADRGSGATTSAEPTAQVQAVSLVGCARQVREGVLAEAGDLGTRVTQGLVSRTGGYLSDQASALSSALGGSPLRAEGGGGDSSASLKLGSPSTSLMYKPRQGVEAARMVNF